MRLLADSIPIPALHARCDRVAVRVDSPDGPTQFFRRYFGIHCKDHGILIRGPWPLVLE